VKIKIVSLIALALSINAYSAAPLNDAQITKVIMTVDKDEMTLGKLAKDSSKNKEVLGFADHMIKDHSKSQKKFSDLAQKLSIVPEVSDKSNLMKAESEKTETELMSQQNTKTFDKAYIDAMITGHQKVLKGIDEELLPSAKNTELRAMLKTKRETVASHLKHAQEVQSKL
jgi:putative membrane protein